MDCLAKAQQQVTTMLIEDSPIQPPSPTVRLERKLEQWSRLQAIRIERKSDILIMSKKMLDERGIVIPQCNHKYFSPGQNVSPMVKVLPLSRL